MKKLFVFLTFVLGLVAFMAWIIAGESRGLKHVEFDEDFAEEGL